MTQKKESQAEAKPFFKARLEMTVIHKDYIRYRVIPEDDNPVPIGFSHLQFERTILKDGRRIPVFPVDDNFNPDFINQDLSDASPYTEAEAEIMTEELKKVADKAFKKMKDNQAEFRKYQTLELVIQ